MDNLDEYLDKIGFIRKEMTSFIEYKNDEINQTITIFKNVVDTNKTILAVENINGFSINDLTMLLNKCNEVKIEDEKHNSNGFN